MGEISDRFLLLLIAVVGFGSILVAWLGAYAEAEMPGWLASAAIGVGILALLAIVVGWYLEFWHLDEEANEDTTG